MANDTELRDTDDEPITRTASKDVKRGRLHLSLWSAIAGFLLFAVGGHWFPGYQLDRTAEVAAIEKATNAVREIMAQLCAERFTMKTSGYESRLAVFRQASSGQTKVSYIRDGTWADTPEGEKADYDTAEACISMITERLAGESEKPS